MIISETTIPAGITALDDTCWHLLYPGEVLVDTGDCIPHFDTEQQAHEEAGRFTSDRLGRPEPHQLDGPCWIATAVCGYRLDEEDAALMHHETAEDALQAALGSEMFIGPDGTLRCSPDCDDCND